MKKIIGFLLLMIVVGWGCSDDEEKQVVDYELPSDFFYQTVWNGQMSPFKDFEFWIGVEFVSETEGRAKTGEDSAIGIGSSNYVEFDYSVEGKVLHISRKDNNYTTRFDGYWFLTYANEAMDSLVFKQDVYEDEPTIMMLKRVSLEDRK